MKSKTLYRDILKNAFNITFKNKILWFFGLFAAPLMGMAEYKIAVNTFGGLNSSGVFSEWYQIINTILSQFGDMGELLIKNPIAVFVLLVIFSIIFLLAFFMVWIAIVAQCALIDGVNKSNSKALTSLKLNASANSGTKNFLSVLGIHFFVKLILSISFLLLSLPIIFAAIGDKNILPEVFYFILSLVFMPIIIIIMFSSKYAINYIVIEKENFFGGVKRGYRLFLDNWLISIEMSLILFFISIFVGLLLTVLSSFIILPLVLLFFILIQMQLIFLLKFIFVLGFLTFIILSLFFAAIFSTFQYSSWVLLFNRLNKEGGKGTGKLARWFSFNR